MTSQSARHPRIGVPWTSTAAQKAGKRRAYSHYLRAVERAGGEPVEISLFRSSAELRELARSLDGYVLPGSAADVDPRRFGARRHAKTADPDRLREHTD